MHPSTFDIYGFADDHQLPKSFLPVLQVRALNDDISNRFQMISQWMYEHFLNLNASKTKILTVIPPPLNKTIVLTAIV